MSPAKLGEYCARCGGKCTVTLEPSPDDAAIEVLVYRCPNGHGIQLITAAPPTGDPTETGTVQWAIKPTDTDIALTAAPTTVVIGSVLLIDSEYMAVNNVSNPDNIGVQRGTNGSVAAAHEAGAAVSIWGTAGQGETEGEAQMAYEAKPSSHKKKSEEDSAGEGESAGQQESAREENGGKSPQMTETN